MAQWCPVTGKDMLTLTQELEGVSNVRRKEINVKAKSGALGHCGMAEVTQMLNTRGIP